MHLTPGAGLDLNLVNVSATGERAPKREGRPDEQVCSRVIPFMLDTELGLDLQDAISNTTQIARIIPLIITFLSIPAYRINFYLNCISAAYRFNTLTFFLIYLSKNWQYHLLLDHSGNQPGASHLYIHYTTTDLQRPERFLFHI